MQAPPVKARGGMLYADLRKHGGQKHVALGLPVGADPIVVGMRVQERLGEIRVAASLRTPELPGLERPGLLVGELVRMYLDARAEDHETDGGQGYVVDYCGYVTRDLGHLPVESLAGKLGSAALIEWRRLMWEREWAPRTVRNALNMAIAVLDWGQDEGRELTGPLPRRPKRFAKAKGVTLGEPDFTTLAEADFRELREHLFDEALHWGTLNKKFPGEKTKEAVQAAVADYIARRKLWLSFGFYTGAHPENCNTLRGEYISPDVRRYERHNTKSSRVVRPCWLDMPEQLALDVEAELRRRNLPRFPVGEIITGPWPWTGHRNAVFAHACERLWPDGSRHYTGQIARRSTVWEYTVRGWSAAEIAIILGHVDETMVREVYRRCSELGLISPVRVPWTVASGPHGRPSRLAPVLELRHGS